MTKGLPKYVIPACLSILLSISFFWSKKFLPGFDTPFYLTAIRDFSRNLPSLPGYSLIDRYLTIGFPAIINKVFGADPILSYKIAITIVSAVLSLLIAKVIFNITKSSLISLGMATTVIISSYLLEYSYMLFANYTGFLILFGFFAIETGKDFRWKDIILGSVLGLVFYTHNFSSIVYCLVIGTYFIFKLILKKNKLSVLKSSLIVFLLSFLIGFFQLIRYFPSTLPPFTTNASSPELVTSLTSKIKSILPIQPTILGDERDRIINTFLDETGKYWLVFFILYISYLIIFQRKELQKRREFLIFPLSLFIVGLVFSLQPVLGLNYLPERFIGLVTLSTFIFYATTLPSFKNMPFYKLLIILPLLLTYLSSDSKILAGGPVFINQTEVTYYQEISSIISSHDSLILVPSGNLYWAEYYLDGYTVIPGDYYISCGTSNYPSYNKAPVIAYAILLTEKNATEAKKEILTIKNGYPDKTIYLMSNRAANCSEGYIFDHTDQLKLVVKTDTYNLYEIN